MMRLKAILILATILALSLAYDATILSTCTGSCTSGCGVCKNSTCSTCQQGYTLNSSANTCSKQTCSINACSVCDSGQITCLKCTDPYSIFNPANSLCIQQCMLPNCVKCKAGSNICQACIAGFSLYGLTNKCIQAAIANCLKVHDFRGQQFQCTLCVTGFKPSTDQTQCIASSCSAISDCQSCTNSAVCSKCRVGFSFSNNKCQANSCNVSNCLYCDSKGICLRCKSAFKLNGNQCVSKSCSLPNCQACKTGSIFCDSCSGSGSSPDIWTNVCGSSSNLKYLGFLAIPVVLIIVVVIVCIYRSRQKQADTTEKHDNVDGKGERIDSTANFKSNTNHVGLQNGVQIKF